MMVLVKTPLPVRMLRYGTSGIPIGGTGLGVRGCTRGIDRRIERGALKNGDCRWVHLGLGLLPRSRDLAINFLGVFDD